MLYQMKMYSLYWKMTIFDIFLYILNIPVWSYIQIKMYRLYRKMTIFLYTIYILYGYNTVVRLTKFLLCMQQCYKMACGILMNP